MKTLYTSPWHEARVPVVEVGGPLLRPPHEFVKILATLTSRIVKAFIPPSPGIQRVFLTAIDVSSFASRGHCHLAGLAALPRLHDGILLHARV